jgi:hypothetical protein
MKTPHLSLLALLLATLVGCSHADRAEHPSDAGTDATLATSEHRLRSGASPSPACLVSDNGGAYNPASPNGVTVSGGDTVAVRLASTAGVQSWALAVFGADELSSFPALTFAPGPPNTYSFTFPAAAGRAVLLQSTVNGGVDVNGVQHPEYTTTIGVFSLVNGARVLGSGETNESCPAGWVCDVNRAIRLAGASGVPTVPTDAGLYGLLVDGGATSWSTIGNTTNLPNAPDASGYYILADDAGNAWWVNPTLDMIGAAFSPSVTLNGGGGTFEVGQTGSPCAPTYNANPQANSGTIAANSPWVDNQGHSTTTSAGNPLANPNGGAYASLTSSGSTITATITETLLSSGATKSASVTGCTFYARWFHGPANDTAPNTGTYTISASGTTALLANSGGGTVSGTGAGVVAVFNTSTTWTDTFTSGQFLFFATPHTSTAHTINGCAPTPCTPLVSVPLNRVATSYSFSNLYSVSVSTDIYESQASQGAQTYQYAVTQ